MTQDLVVLRYCLLFVAAFEFLLWGVARVFKFNNMTETGNNYVPVCETAEKAGT